MTDLIRRIDALQACQVGPSDEWSRSTKSGYNQAATDCAMNILRIPAVQPDAREAALREALNGLLTLVEHADFAEGWCCCGDDMLHHQSPMDCGHTPVDIGVYHASLAIEKARAALKGGSHE